jgi:hypothetical protein
MLFEIRTGAVDSGWCDFSVRLGDGSWSCKASYIGHHPLHPLIHSTVDLYNHIFEEPIPVEHAVWDSVAQDEPGGIVIRAIPKSGIVNVKIFCQSSDNPIAWSSGQASILPVGEGMIDYWSYADAIYRDAAEAIVRQGIMGLRNAWEPGRWDIDSHSSVLPIEHFLYLAALIKYRSPKPGMGFADELSLLSQLGEKYYGKHKKTDYRE